MEQIAEDESDVRSVLSTYSYSNADANNMAITYKTGAIEIRGSGTGRQTTLVNFRSCVTSDQNTLTPPNFHNALAIIFLTE